MGAEGDAKDPMLVRGLGWIAGTTGIGALLLCVVGVVLEIAGLTSPRVNRMLGIPLLFLIITWVGTFLAWGALEAYLVDEEGHWRLGTGGERAFRLLGAGTILALALAGPLICLLVVAGGGLIDENIGAVAGLVGMALAMGSLVVAAVAGGVALGGWRWSWVGLLLVAGMVVGAVGIVRQDLLTGLAGLGAVAAATALFYVIGIRAGAVPDDQLALFGGPVGLVIALVAGGFGLATGRWAFVVLAGVGIAVFLAIRFTSPPEPEPAPVARKPHPRKKRR